MVDVPHDRDNGGPSVCADGGAAVNARPMNGLLSRRRLAMNMSQKSTLARPFDEFTREPWGPRAL